MQKMQIVLDENKIAQNSKYTVDKLQSKIDSILVDDRKFDKHPNGFYLGCDDRADFGRFMSAILYLKDQEWFMDNVKSWTWFNNDETSSPNDFETEDILQHYLDTEACDHDSKTARMRALNFDLLTDDLRALFDEAGRVRAYNTLRKYLEENGFEHHQGSGYHSYEPLTDLQVIDLMEGLFQTLPWFAPCVRSFDITNIGQVHDLIPLGNQYLVDHKELLDEYRGVLINNELPEEVVAKLN